MAGITLIVDLDGTVWDSDLWYRRLAGIPPGGRTNAARELRAAGVTRARFSRAAFRDPPPLYAGMRELVRDLARPGGVATNLPGWMARPLLEATGLKSWLPVVVDFGATRAHKPRPEPLLECAERLREKPWNCVYLGDDPNDLFSAHAAGMQFAWAAWGYTSDPPPGTDVVVEHPLDLKPMVGSVP